MFIDPNLTQEPAPLGGAEDVLMSTRLLEFRSSERRWVLCNIPVYKHLTPSGVMNRETKDQRPKTADH